MNWYEVYFTPSGMNEERFCLYRGDTDVDAAAKFNEDRPFTVINKIREVRKGWLKE